MKYCTNCGTQLSDDAVFCEQCGTKQGDIEQNNISSMQESSTTNTPMVTSNSNKKGKMGCFISIIAIILSIIFVITAVRSCSSPNSLENTASDFAEALLIDFDAKKAVSLMSSDLIEYYFKQTGVSSEKELVTLLKATFKSRKQDTIGYYGDDWRAKIIEVDVKKVENDLALVVVSVSHEGSDALWNTNIDKVHIYLIQEDNKWYVCNFES